MTDPRDAQLIGLIRSMLARPEYLLPLAAADRQYRDHYYRLNAAALLEDLFFDALGNHVRQTHPELEMHRAVGGGHEWDYALGDWRVSHKVLSKVGQVAVHWDATVTATTWSANHSIVIVLSQADPGRWLIDGDTGGFRVRAAGPSDALVAGRRALVVEWAEDEAHRTARVLAMETIRDGADELREVLPFDVVWSHVAGAVRGGSSASRIDVLLTESARANPAIGGDLRTSELRLPAGVYLVPASYLQDVHVRSNNRSAKLMTRETVASAMAAAHAAGLFVRMPLWFRCYAGSRPPDLYAAQRGEFDTLFSARVLHTE